MAEQEASGKSTQSSSSGSSRSTGPFSFTNPLRKWSPKVDKQSSQDEDGAGASAQSDKETKDTTDTVSASPSLKRKETSMSVVKTFLSAPLQKTATWIQSPFLSFLTKHRMKNEEIHKLFSELPEEEKLIDDYACALQREILLQGRLYITQNWLCFYANILTWVTLLTIPFKAIQSVTKEKTANLFPYAIQVCTSTDKYGFHSFMQRDVAFRVIFRVWQNNLLSEQLAMTPMELFRSARKATGDDVSEDITPDDLWGPVKLSREKNTSTSSSTGSLTGDTTATSDSGATSSSSATQVTSSSSGRSAVRQFSSHLDFNLFRSFRSQKSQSSSEGKSNQLPGIKEQDADSAAHTSDVTSDSVTTETEEVLPTAPARETTLLKEEEANATQNGSPASSRRSEMDYVIVDPVNGDGDRSLHDQQSLKSKQHSESSLSALTPGGGGDMNDIISVAESMRSSEFEFEASSICDEIGEVSCGCSEHTGNLILNEAYNCDVESLFQMLFTDHEFIRAFLKGRRTVNLEFGEWVSQPDNSKLRDIKYTLSLNYSFGPKFSPSTEHQIYSKEGQMGLKHTVNTEVVNGNIPYGDSFYVCCQFCMTRMAHNKSRCRVTSHIVFRKSCWGLVKSLIERNAADGLRSYYSQLDTSLKEYLANLPAKKLHRKPYHRSRSRYKNTPPLMKKTMDSSGLGEVGITTPKSNSGLTTPNSMQTPGGDNDSNADKPTISMASVVQKLTKDELSTTSAEQKTQIPRTTIFISLLLCCVLVVNLLVYVRLINNSQSGSGLHQSDINWGNIKIKEWPSSHEDWVELVKKQVESHDLENESWMKTMASLVEAVDQIQSMANEMKLVILEEMRKRRDESQPPSEHKPPTSEHRPPEHNEL
ncbi:protein Aster-A-like isoform X3 [Dysidea avara]|uniref:protein Aster-A-like isoform X3 n=1 Tax=Dysidea avara TaxID=196820 RepID=UPI00331D8DC1